MKQPKIDRALADNRRRLLSIRSSGKTYSIPFERLDPPVKKGDRIVDVAVDAELAYRGVTYRQACGVENSVPLDAFLDHNLDPQFMEQLLKYRLTLAAQLLIKRCGISKNEITRRMHTSPAQLARLLDQANYRKSADQMIRLLSVLGCTLEISITELRVPKAQRQAALRDLKRELSAA